MIQKRLQAAKTQIINYFDNSMQAIYKQRELAKIFNDSKERWELDSATSTNKFIAFMLKETKLQKAQLAFPHRKETRYLWGGVSAYALALSLGARAYLSHQTAMEIHGLTSQPINNIFVNIEQPPRRQITATLEQQRIDVAFQNKARMTNNRAKYEDKIVWLLNGMHTGNNGVTEDVDSSGHSMRFTDLERTLIDIAVRPAYSGGASEVLRAYQLARERVSLQRLAEILRKLGYIYPYHQAIGFYLDRAGGYNEALVEMFLEPGLHYDFYLEHQMQDARYDDKWRLYYPANL